MDGTAATEPPTSHPRDATSPPTENDIKRARLMLISPDGDEEDDGGDDGEEDMEEDDEEVSADGDASGDEVIPAPPGGWKNPEREGMGGSCRNGFLKKPCTPRLAKPNEMLRFVIYATVLMSPGFVRYAMHSKGNASRGGATVGPASFRLANNLIEVLTMRLRRLGYVVSGSHGSTTAPTKWSFFHAFADDRLPLYMIRRWWKFGPCFFGEAWVRWLYDTINGMSKADSWDNSRKIVDDRKYTTGHTLCTLFHSGGKLRIDAYGDLLDVFEVPESERSIIIDVEKGYAPFKCLRSVEFVCDIYFKTHGVNISARAMQLRLRADLHVTLDTKGPRIKSDTNHANGIRFTIIPP